MDSGELNKLISLQAETGGQDTYGQAGGTWVDLASIWSAIIVSGGREFYTAQKMNAETSAVFKIRYRRNITPKHRIKYGIRIFEILSIIDPLEKHEELLISCKEVV